MVGNDSHRLRWRHHETFALIQRHLELELAHTQPVAIEKTARIAPADRSLLVIDKDPVGAGIDEIERARLKIDRRVFAGQEVVGIRQYPVVLEGPADGATRFPKLTHIVTAKNFLVVTDYFKEQRHRVSRSGQSAGKVLKGRSISANTAVFQRTAAAEQVTLSRFDRICRIGHKRAQKTIYASGAWGLQRHREPDQASSLKMQKRRMLASSPRCSQ